MALLKGWVPAFSRLGPQTILTFVFMEKMREFYRHAYDLNGDDPASFEDANDDGGGDDDQNAVDAE